MKPLALAPALAGLVTLAFAARGPHPAAEAPALTVGTFDSRAVAVAYAHSPSFRTWLADQRAELERARADGDTTRVAELEELGPDLQERLHRQGFGTASVDELLEPHRGRFAAIAEEAGVDVIVSKWALTWVGPEASFVDVTDLLVDPFEPDAETKQRIRELLATEPVPEEALGEHDH